MQNKHLLICYNWNFFIFFLITWFWVGWTGIRSQCSAKKKKKRQICPISKTSVRAGVNDVCSFLEEIYKYREIWALVAANGWLCIMGGSVTLICCIWLIFCSSPLSNAACQMEAARCQWTGDSEASDNWCLRGLCLLDHCSFVQQQQCRTRTCRLKSLSCLSPLYHSSLSCHCLAPYFLEKEKGNKLRNTLKLFKW